MGLTCVKEKKIYNKESYIHIFRLLCFMSAL